MRVCKGHRKFNQLVGSGGRGVLVIAWWWRWQRSVFEEMAAGCIWVMVVAVCGVLII